LHTCIGNSGPLLAGVPRGGGRGWAGRRLVLSGNRNFEGRINPDVRLNYLASPPLVVAYALAGSMDFDIVNEPLGTGTDGAPVYLRDVWPSSQEVAAVMDEALSADMFEKSYAEVFLGDERWSGLDVPPGELYEWGRARPTCAGLPISTLCPRRRHPSGHPGARALAGWPIPSPRPHLARRQHPQGRPAGAWLIEHGVARRLQQFMGRAGATMRSWCGARSPNVRLRNQLARGRRWFYHPLWLGEQTTIYDARHALHRGGHGPWWYWPARSTGRGLPGTGRPRAQALLGVRAVLAESFERIHRSNLIGMGCCPSSFLPGESASSLGLTGQEVFDVTGLEGSAMAPCPPPSVKAGDVTFEGGPAHDTRSEADYYRHGGILPYVLRQLRRRSAAPA